MIYYLVHSGVKDQKRGVRRYQYKDGSLTPLGREHYGVGPPRSETGDHEAQKESSSATEKTNRTEENRTEKESSSATEKTNRTEEENRRIQEAISSGDAKKIQEYKNKMSDDEINAAINRINLNNRLDDAIASINQQKMNKAVTAFDNTMKVVGFVQNFTNTVTNIRGNVDKYNQYKQKQALQEKMDQIDVVARKNDIDYFINNSSKYSTEELARVAVRKKQEQQLQEYSKGNWQFQAGQNQNQDQKKK